MITARNYRLPHGDSIATGAWTERSTRPGLRGAPGDCTTAVCVQYDTHLRLENISGDLQTRLGVKAEEDVVFARLEHGAYRDGVRFTNGKEVSLQLLGSGVGATLTAIVKAPAPAIVEVRSDILEHVD